MTKNIKLTSKSNTGPLWGLISRNIPPIKDNLLALIGVFKKK